MCDDMVVRIVDVETHKVVRELTGFRGRILDIVRSSSLIFYSQLTCIDLLSGLALARRHRLGLHHSDIRYSNRTFDRRLPDEQRGY
jgi:hypothetical protein